MIYEMEAAVVRAGRAAKKTDDPIGDGVSCPELGMRLSWNVGDGRVVVCSSYRVYRPVKDSKTVDGGK